MIEGTEGVPSLDRAFHLIDMAVTDNDVKVLGYADDMVMLSDEQAGGPFRVLTFDVSTTLAPENQESSVLVIAIRIPHPDFMTLKKVVNG